MKEKDEKCFVYLARLQEGGRFKIGLSRKPYVRLRSIADKIDCSNIMVARCANSSYARGLEQALHSKFRVYNVVPHAKEGRTEWFSSLCYDKVISFIQEGVSRLGYEEFYRLPEVSKLTEEELRESHPKKYQEPPFSLRMKDSLKTRVLALKVEGETWHATVVRLLTLGVQTAESALRPPVETQIELSDPPWEPTEVVTPNGVQIELCSPQEPTQVPVKVESKPSEEEDYFKGTDFAQ
jgi:hypothetical protein